MDRQRRFENEQRAIDRVAKAIQDGTPRDITYEQARRDAQKIAEQQDGKRK